MEVKGDFQLISAPICPGLCSQLCLHSFHRFSANILILSVSMQRLSVQFWDCGGKSLQCAWSSAYFIHCGFVCQIASVGKSNKSLALQTSICDLMKRAFHHLNTDLTAHAQPHLDKDTHGALKQYCKRRGAGGINTEVGVVHDNNEKANCNTYWFPWVTKDTAKSQITLTTPEGSESSSAIKINGA